MKGNSQHQVTMVWLVMFAFISFLLASIAVVSQNEAKSRGIENTWFSRLIGKQTKTVDTIGDDADPYIEEIGNIANDYDYVEPEETLREKVIRETNERFIQIIGIQEIE